ncbi:hypothetical protein X801_00173, partial [Opisthorchis viverrini]
MTVHFATTGETNPDSYASRLRHYMRDTRPSPTRQPSKPTQVHPDIATRKFVFVRDDPVRKRLQPPYKEPFRVISRKDKTFVIDHDVRKDTVKTRQLEGAYVQIRPTPNDKHTATLPLHRETVASEMMDWGTRCDFAKPYKTNSGDGLGFELANEFYKAKGIKPTEEEWMRRIHQDAQYFRGCSPSKESSSATRRSQARANSRPPPIARPVIAAIKGLVKAKFVGP